jgi:NADH dehydrogenase
MADKDLRIVTGAFGFTGRHVTELLLARGLRVRTLTGHPERPNPFGERVEARGFSWDDPAALAESLRGAEVLYNTYWIRFARGELTFQRAEENSRALFIAAREAGVRRVVHVSIANPSADSALPYYSGKARVEQALAESGLEYAILRPTVIFGDEGILLNNIAWMLRHLPVFATPRDGEYQLQPVYVGDLAGMMVEAGEGAQAFQPVQGKESREAQAGKPVLLRDAAGPETYSFNELLAVMKRVLGRRTAVLHLPEGMVRAATGVLGWALGDVILTRDEVEGLRQNLLISHQPATGTTRLSAWLEENKGWLGARYMSEVRKHYR